MILTSLLLTTSTLFASAPVVNASSTALAISPPVSVATLGGTFTVSVSVTDVLNLNAYDITVNFDASQLSYVSSNLPAPWTNALFQKLPSSVREVAFIVGGGSVSVPAGSTSTLVNYTFRMNLSGQSLLTMSPSGLFASGNPIAHAVATGLVKSAGPKPFIRLDSAAPTSPTVDFTKGQSSVDLIASIHTVAGNTSGTGFMAYRMISLSGTVFVITSASFTIPANSHTTSTTTFSLDPLPDTFVGTAALFFSSDGVTFQLLGVVQLSSSIQVIV